MAPQRRSRPKVEPHPLVEALVPDPSKPPERTTKMFGFPGSSPREGSTRLWLDADLTSYADIPDEAILYSRTLPDDEGTVLWVRASAPISYESVSSHEAQAEFLTGAITATHLGAAAGGEAAYPMQTFIGCPRPTLFPPCGYTVYPGCPPPPTTSPTLLTCCRQYTISPLQCRPSMLIPCHTTLTLACKPSVLVRCPSQQLICPTSPGFCNITLTALCRPTLVGCPTRLSCPSVSVPCETTPGCPLPTFGCEFELPIEQYGGGGFG